MERFFLKTFGCKVNQYDGQGLRERLLESGLAEADCPEEANLLVVNFCVVTGRSASRCHRSLKGLVRRRPKAQVIISGCLSPEDRGRVREYCPGAIFASEAGAPGPMREYGIALSEDAAWRPVSGLKSHTRAFVKVQDGCNLRCSYCIVPSIRGAERSRPDAAVSEEVGRLLEAGHRELVLCGIRLGAYRYDGVRLEGLLRTLLKDHPGSYRIRLSSLNPPEVTAGLLEVMGSDRRVARHLHLPLQSGDQGILRSMHRPYTPRRYLEKVDEIRRALDDPAISTDLMVGFPGESDEAFQASLDVLERARVSRVHVFPFSPRRGTEAASWPRVPDQLKAERTRAALETARRLKERFDRNFIGREDDILVERAKEGPAGLPTGLTSRYQKTAVRDRTSGTEKNTFVRVVLEDYRNGLFTGRVIGKGSNGRQE